MRNLLVFIPAVLFFVSCRIPQKKESVLFSVGNTPISTQEFLYVYKKNNLKESEQDSIKAMRDYLDLFINFKLKVKEAESLGLDTTKSFIEEFEGYRKQLAQPYLSDKRYLDSLVTEAYERLKLEINASHILIPIGPTSRPEDTLRAFNKIIDLRNRALNGEEFGDLASKFSGDSSAKFNRGNLGYFTAMQMVYPFETIAYQTSEGDISMPVRTQFGYHIIKVNSVRPSQGQVQVAHLMIRSTTGESKPKADEAKDKIHKLYEQLKNGGNWDDLVKQFSEDQNSKNKGGQLDWFGVGSITPAFENAAFALEKGEISLPVQTPYGWHIIKLIDKKPLESLGELKNTIKSRVNRESRSEASTEVFVFKLMEEYGFEEDQEGRQVVQALIDSFSTSGIIPVLSSKESQKGLFKVNNTKYLVKDFYTFLKKNAQKLQNTNYYKDFLKTTLLEIEEARLPEKYEDYRMLVKEYREGILLFTLMDENVWSKAVKDTIGLNNFYEDNREVYASKEFADVLIISFGDSVDMIKSLDSLKLIDNLENQNLVAVSTALNQNNPLRVAIQRDTVEKNSESYWEVIPWKVGEYSANVNGRYTFFKILDIFRPDDIKLDDIRGQVISDYQKFLEDNWLDTLRKKYPVKVNERELKRIGISN